MPVAFIVHPFADVGCKRIFLSTLPVAFAVVPLAGIVIPVGIGQGALTVKFAIQKVALIDGTIVKFNGAVPGTKVRQAKIINVR